LGPTELVDRFEALDPVARCQSEINWTVVDAFGDSMAKQVPTKSRDVAEDILVTTESDTKVQNFMMDEDVDSFGRQWGLPVHQAEQAIAPIVVEFLDLWV